VANKTQCLQCLWALPNNLKHNEARFSTTLKYLLVTQMSRSGDFVVTDRQADKTDYVTPLCMCAG
jgi:hypothetical protein